MKNPHQPGSLSHQAWSDGFSAAMNGESTRPPSMCQAVENGRAPIAQLLNRRAADLRRQADNLEALAKFTTPMDDTPAADAMWDMMFGAR